MQGLTYQNWGGATFKRFCRERGIFLNNLDKGVLKNLRKEGEGQVHIASGNGAVEVIPFSRAERRSRFKDRASRQGFQVWMVGGIPGTSKVAAMKEWSEIVSSV